MVAGRTPEPTSKPWVFVHVPIDPTLPPEFFVLTQAQLHDLLAPVEAKYRQRYREKHGIEAPNIGVATLPLAQAEPYEGRWNTIIAAVKAAN